MSPHSKRLLKRLRLEKALRRAEQERAECEKSGVHWAGTTKSALTKQAAVGKNYIDMLDDCDDIAQRVRNLLSSHKNERAERKATNDKQKDNLSKLKHQLSIQAQENQSLTARLTRAISEISRLREQLNIYERHYNTRHQTTTTENLKDVSAIRNVIDISSREPHEK